MPDLPGLHSGAGRFAPSPSGDLHLGNLRTAILAWLFARSTERRFLLRIEDLDRDRAGFEAQQLRDLALIGVDWDEPPLRQSERSAQYHDAIAELRAQGMLYECFCTRRDIVGASSAPHSTPGRYPGTCRDLSEAERIRKRGERPAAWRLRGDNLDFQIHDVLHGEFVGLIDDLVLLRNDGAPAYNLAVVVDDALQGIDQVVRGDDLLSAAPAQAYLGSLLGYPAPEYVHLPLALNPAGRRLAKRDGAVTLADVGVAKALDLIFGSLGLPPSPQRALAEFDPTRLSRVPWVVRPAANGGTNNVGGGR